LLAGLLAVAMALPGCGTRPVTAKAPEWKPEGETKCKITKSQSRPLIIEWPSNDRVALEATMKDGVALVRATGCEVEVLHRCKASSSRYGYRGTSKESDSVSIRDEDDLYANLPLGAASLSGKLQTSGSLNVNMAVVGRYISEGNEVNAGSLQGDGCERATHYISAVSVGAFTFFAGGAAEAGAGVNTGLGVGAGARTSSSREELKSGGNVASCDLATRKDSEPPDGCGALLRIEIVPLPEERRTANPACPPGKSWDGSRCVESGGALPAPTSRPAATSRPASTPTARPRPAPSTPPPSSLSKLSSPVFTAGGYSLIFGTILLSSGGIGAFQQKRKLEENPGWCSGDRCTEEGTSARKAGRAFSIVANVGAGLMALGGVLIWLAPSSKTTVGLSLDGLRFAGEF
jgi:hypothetical protein